MSKDHYMVHPPARVSFYGLIEELEGRNSAYWLLQQEMGQYAEIDVVEYDRRLGKLYFTCYLNEEHKWQEKPGTIKKQGKVRIKPSFLDVPHVWSIRWTLKSLTWYVDNVPIFRIRRSIPQHPMFLMMNNILPEWVKWVVVEDLKD
jgi:beta-glucanase (GH16 family)